MSLGWAHCRAGRIRSGVEILAAVAPAFQGGRHVPSELTATPYLVEGYFLAGDYDRARQTAEEAVTLSKGCGAKFFLGCEFRLLGEIATAYPKGGLGDADLYLKKGLALLEEVGETYELGRAESSLEAFRQTRSKD